MYLKVEKSYEKSLFNWQLNLNIIISKNRSEYYIKKETPEQKLFDKRREHKPILPKNAYIEREGYHS